MTPIGVVESCYGEKFGTPRQSGIVSSARGRIIFNDEVDPEATRGLEGFSHIWVIFLFDQVSEGDVRWLVRPPRLGGNEKKGVYATRSPFRPNRIGLSLVKLEKVTSEGVFVSGLDLVNGTLIFDLKPYLPYVESVPNAYGGYAEKEPEHFPVDISKELREVNDSHFLELVTESLSLDPRPAYHDDSERVYGCEISARNVKWQVYQGRVKVIEII